MADPTTSNRSYAVPTRGSDAGTWDIPLNTNFGLLDNNLGGVSTVALSNAQVALTSGQYQCGTIRLTGVLTANVTVAFPAVSGWWTIDNQTTGDFFVLLTCGNGSNIATESGAATDIFTDGANVAFRDLGRIGGYWDYAGNAVPLWVQACTVPPFLNCNGATFDAALYPRLNTILGGNKLPDLRGTTRATLNQGTGRITTNGSGLDGDTNLSVGGTETIVLSAAQIPSITSSGSMSGSASVSGATTVQVIVNGSGANAIGGGGPFGFPATAPVSASGSASVSGSVTSSNTGGAGHPNVQPTTIAGITMIRAA